MPQDLSVSWHLTVMTFLILIFLKASIHKGSDIRRFSGYIANYSSSLTPYSLFLAYLLLAYEGTAVVLSLIPSLSVFGNASLVLLLTVYALAMLTHLRSGKDEIDCGCGGPSIVISIRSIGRNVVLWLLSLSLLFTSYEPATTGIVIVAVIGGLMCWMAYTLIEQLLQNHDRFLKLKFELNKKDF